MIESAEYLNWLDLLDKRVEIKWRDPWHDWPYFYVRAVRGQCVRLQGADFPDGSAEHDGDSFWVDFGDVREVSVVKS